jgi:lipopolysaccharide transport system ATP-binding protein
LQSLPRFFARKARRAAGPAAAPTQNPRVEGDQFWALRDLDLEIKRGEAVGIIGRNGAGKSTLLKILSRITAPTTGRVELRGRVGALLEVGTGFHSELTGRENIYLNGSILGMRKQEIDRKFDEIVEFAGVGEHLDTPVKRYSSGMGVRLGFAVAAHLEPEILIVDEVLSVGDAEFQRKCLGKIESVTKQDRTVLFVTHNMAAVQNLCTRAILLREGRLVQTGGVPEVVASYLQALKNPGLTEGEAFWAESPDGTVQLTGVEFLDEAGNPAEAWQCGAEGRLRLRIATRRDLRRMLVSAAVETQDSVRLSLMHSGFSGAQLQLESPGGVIDCTIPRCPFMPGMYYLSLKVMANGEHLFSLTRFVRLTVESGDFYKSGALPATSWGGLTLIDQQWSTHPYAEDAS